jgi:hypothetical protein
MDIISTCCGQLSEHLDIRQGDSVLTFALCQQCQRSTWRRDGLLVELDVDAQVDLVAGQQIDALV